MREIINLHVGQAGVQMGDSCWELLRLEQQMAMEEAAGKHDGPHPKGASNTDCLKHDTFFYTTSKNEMKPRALLIDLEPSVVDKLNYGTNRDFFTSEHVITGKEDAANNFARGYYTVGRTILEEVLDKTRRFVENCSQLQAFSLFHSCGGGTGSGFSAALLENLQQLYPKTARVSFSCWPSPLITTAVVEPYNSVFTASALTNLTDFTVMLDNQAIYDICQSSLVEASPSYDTLNQMISQVVSAWTASLRFQGSLNVDVNEIQVNLVPFPRIHYLLSSYAPLFPAKASNVQESNSSVNAITSAAFQADHVMAKCNPSKGKFISCCLMYRGDVTPRDANAALLSLKNKGDISFVDWCPTGFKCGLNNQPPVFLQNKVASVKKAVCMMSNNTAMHEVFERTATKFDMLFARRAFVHWYVSEDMEESEFSEAQENMAVLQRDYEIIVFNNFESDVLTTDGYEDSETSNEE